MDELFFGVKRKKTRRSPARKTRRSPRRSPRRVRRSPTRKTRMCNKKLSLPKLRKLAVENGVNIFSEAKTAVSKRTGMPKKPKMVGCSTLMKRLNEAGLGHLYKVREVHVMPDEQGDLFMEEPMTQRPEVLSPMPTSVLMQADPACASAFQKLAEKQPNNRAQAKFLKEYKGYAMGQGPCEKRQLVPTHIHGSEDDLDDYAEVAGFDMSYGRRYMSGARPKKSQKHVCVIEVKGRTHHVFKGKEGGLYYLKGKTGKKVYVDKNRLKKRKSRFGDDEEEDEEEMEFGRRYMSGARPKKSQKHVGVIEVKGRTHHVFKGKEGGLYYLKGKTGRKVYIDKERLRKRK